MPLKKKLELILAIICLAFAGWLFTYLLFSLRPEKRIATYRVLLPYKNMICVATDLEAPRLVMVTVQDYYLYLDSEKPDEIAFRCEEEGKVVTGTVKLGRETEIEDGSGNANTF